MNVKPMITNTQMPQYVDWENDCQSRPWVFPDQHFPAYHARIYYKNLKSTPWNIDMTDKKYPAHNLPHSFTIVIDEMWELQPQHVISNL